jgi:hypothetical protein
MNQRIKEFALEATDDIMGVKILNQKKFAELIVWECVDLSLGSSHRDDDMGAIIADKIKRHFGVE